MASHMAGQELYRSFRARRQLGTGEDSDIQGGKGNSGALSGVCVGVSPAHNT